MIKFNEEIMKKVEQKEREEAYITRCLDVNICPVCGETVSHEFFNDGSIRHRCLSESCNFTHSN